MDIVQPVNDSV